MDMQMPVMDGIEATKRIRKDAEFSQYSKVPILAMTANVLPEDEAKCIAAGMDGYLTKPIDISKVKAWLEQHDIL